MWCDTRRCIVACIILCWTTLICDTFNVNKADTFPREFDFRYTSYEDLLQYTSTFQHQDIVGFPELTLDEDNDQLLVGARDSLFRLSLDHMTLIEYADVTTSASEQSMCSNKGQSEETCHNYIRVMLLHNYTATQGYIQDPVVNYDHAVFICGTNAFKPTCSWRPANNLSHVIEESTGIGKTPYSPLLNSTAIITENGDFYSATMVGPGNRDPAIFRTGSNTVQLRSAESNSKWLNEPDFISTYEIGDFVYFFFREVAVEFINCGKRIYSRVARVCKTDEGGAFFENTWTTYYKSRLNCSLPGEYPFYYDEIQSTYLLEDGEEKYLYAVFTTSMNSIAASAVCVFNMTAFNDSFTGPYKYQENTRAAWERHDNPYPMVKCPEQKDTNKRSNEQKIKESMIESKYQLMDQAVQPDVELPLLHADNERWTHVVVDNVPGKKSVYTVIFVATADGKIRKMTNIPSTNETCLIEEIKIVPNGDHKPVKTMKLSSKKMAIYITTANHVIKIPVHRCSRFTNSDLCINSMDPYCGWDDNQHACTPPPFGQTEVHYWSQSMAACPFVPHPVDGDWSSWSDWTTCSQVGGGLEAGDCKCRSRSCDNPKPFYGGQTCQGSSVEVTNCTAHGQWTDWSDWSSCSATCGSTATHRRQRYCSNPPPRYGGRGCLGSDKDEEYCQGHPPCPLPPVQSNWTEWGEWSECSNKCNGGIQTRRRNCKEPPTTQSLPCVGNIQEWRMCNTHICEEIHQMTPWTPWVTSNETKGGYFENRYRFMCRAQVPSQNMIKAKHIKTQTRFCFDGGQCHDSDVALIDNVDGDWSVWSTWSKCTRDCDGGMMWRHRTCNNPKPLGGGKECVGHAMEGRECNIHSCQGVWGCWSEMSSCSVTCGQGVQARSRQCESLPPGKPYSIPCTDDNVEYIPCDAGPCFNVVLGRSMSGSGDDGGYFEKPRFSLAQMFLVGGLSFFLGGSASLALFAYIQSFRKAMIHAKQQERIEKLEKKLRQQKELQRNHSKVSIKHMPSLSSQMSLDTVFCKSRVYDVEAMMRDSMRDSFRDSSTYETENPYATLDRNCSLQTFTIKDL